jgi:N-acetylglucosamine-6-phosphate deacetylase
MYAIVNGKVFDGEKFLEGIALVIDGKQITHLIKESELEMKYPSLEKKDARGGYITPGFIDLQINGCGGVLFNDDISEETLRTMHRTNLKSGCTSYLPTLITSRDEKILKALDLIDRLKDSKEDIGVLGLHIEGPYISVERKGIHNSRFIRKIDKKMLDRICQTGGEGVKILTLAPENNDGKTISALVQSGIKVALGHTNATYSQIEEKKIHGITLATHLYNGMSTFTHRDPGAVGAVLDSNIYAGIIVDGFHSDFASVSIAHKIKRDKLYLVTDAVAPVGTDMEYFYFEGNKVYHKDGKCFGEDGTLGGSALTMIEGIKNLVESVHLSLEEAIRMATLYPAKALGIENRYGKLLPGYPADIVILDKKLSIIEVISKGISI